MQIQTTRGKLWVRVGTRFGTTEAERLYEGVLALGPFTHLTVDFTAVREFHDAALPLLARTLGALPRVEVALRGLTLHQRRMLSYVNAAWDGAA
jgi:hypothetical protein